MNLSKSIIVAVAFFLAPLGASANTLGEELKSCMDSAELFESKITNSKGKVVGSTFVIECREKAAMNLMASALEYADHEETALDERKQTRFIVYFGAPENRQSQCVLTKSNPTRYACLFFVGSDLTLARYLFKGFKEGALSYQQLPLNNKFKAALEQSDFIE